MARDAGGGKLLSFLLGLLLGIILIVGSVVGVGVYVYNKPIDDTVKLADKFVEGDLYAKVFGTAEKAGFLNAKYAEEKVGALIKDTAEAVKALTGDGALSSLNEISPKVGETVDKVLKQTDKYGIPFSKEELMSKSLKDAGSYAKTQLKATALGDLLKGLGKADEELLLTICYGERDKDFTTDAEGNIVMLGDAKKVTIDDLMGENGLNDAFNRLTLESVMSVNPDDEIMCALAYGSADHYEVVDGKVKMLPITYTYNASEGKLYDIQGNVAEGVYDPATQTLTIGGAARSAEDATVYYLKAEEGVLRAYGDEARTNLLHYPKTKVSDLSAKAETIVDDLYLSDVLSVDNSAHKVIISLAYGAEGKDYDVVNGQIVLRPGVKPRTIGDLKKENKELIDGIQLKDALGIDASSHKILISLAYGTENEDFKYVTEGGVTKIEMLGDSTPRTLGNLSEDSTGLINGILLKDALDITPSSHKVLISLAYGTENVHFKYVTEGGVTKIEMLGDNKPRTLQSLTENSDGLINDIQLADALGVTPKSHKVLISLAYGVEGKNFRYVGEGENKKIEMLNGSLPRTLGMLTENSDSLINDIYLTDVLSPDPDSTVIMYLLYGKKDIHYSVNGETVTPLQQRILLYNGNLYNAYGEPITGSLSDYNTEIGTGANATQTIRFKTTDEKGETVYTSVEAKVYFLLDDNNEPLLYESITLGALSQDDNPISKINSRLTIGEVLGEGEASGNFFLKHVKNETLESLPTAINNLKITDVYHAEIYVKDEQGNEVVTGTWKYLLTDKGTGKITEYKVSELGDLVPNMTANIQKAKLSDLQADGMLTSLDDDTLGTDIPEYIPVQVGGNTAQIKIPYKRPENKTKIGHLTVNELFDFVSAIIKLTTSTQNVSLN